MVYVWAKQEEEKDCVQGGEENELVKKWGRGGREIKKKFLKSDD